MRVIFSILLMVCLSAASVLALASGDYLYEINSSDANSLTITDYIGYDTIVNIPSSMKGMPVTAIGENAFRYNDNIIKVSIPLGVVSIGNNAFHLCGSLREIHIPESVTSIGDQAFDYCKSLESVVIPDDVVSLSFKAFYGCSSLENVSLGSELLSVEELSFSGCSSLMSITIPENVRYVDPSAFVSCSSLLEILVDAGNSVFQSVDGILFADNNSVLLRCPQTKSGEYVIPDGITLISAGAFSGCLNLSSVLMPDSLVYISNEAFKDCTGLSTIDLPENVIHIGPYAFRSCSNLVSIEIPESVSYIGSYAFYGCGNLINISIPSGITTIGNSTFKLCRSLTHITIPSGVTSIGDSAFSSCNFLAEIYFNGNAPLAGNEEVFLNCDGVVYYREGTTGWESTYASLPTASWNPLISTDESFGVSSNGFGFTVLGAENELVKVETCTNLNENTWDDLETSSLSDGLYAFSDAEYTNNGVRFYRLNMP